MRRILTACAVVLACVAGVGVARPAAQAPAAQAYYLLAAATTNATVLRGCQPTYLTGATLFNLSSTPSYLRVYNQCTVPTEANTPRLVLVVPGTNNGQGLSAGTSLGQLAWTPDAPIYFPNGLSFRTTTGIAVDNTTAVSANQLVINLTYY